MLTLTNVEMKDERLHVIYNVKHSGGDEYTTTLDQDLHLIIDPRTGAVTGNMNVTSLKADDLEGAITKLAEWMDRLGMALREPRKVTAMVPVFERDWDK